jgi:general secretion pathway protein K
MTSHHPSGREGMILLNVLLVVSVAAIVVMLMVTSQDVAIDRTVRFREAAQAAAYARAGEASAIVALRRDAAAAPASDHAREPWGVVEDRDVAIRGGRFSLKVHDDQARFNLNSIGAGNLVAQARFARILEALGLSESLLNPVVTYVSASGPVTSVDELLAVGLRPEDIETLSQLVTVLPRDTAININTADERLLAVLFDSPVTARLLASKRQRDGYLTPADLAGLNAFLPPGAGFTSSFFTVETEVQVGDTRQRIASSLARRASPSGTEVVVYARERLDALPAEPPPTDALR